MDNITRIQLLQCHASDVNSLDFGPKDRLATASSDHYVRLWNWDRSAKKFVEDAKSPLKHHTFSVNEVRFSPQGTMLATGSTDGTAVIWDLATCTVLCSFVQPSRLGVRCCRFSPDSSMLVTSGDDDSACIWNVGSRSLMRKFRDNEHTVFCSEFTPDSKHLFTSDANGDLRLWDVASNHNKSLVCVEEAHDLGVLCCEFAPWNEDNDSTSLDRKFILATGGNDDCVKLWTVITGLNVKIVSRKRLSGDHSSAVMCLRFTKDGKFLASTGGDKLVCIYSVESGLLMRKLHHHDRYVGSCAFSWTGSFFATGSNDKSVAIFDWLDHDANMMIPTLARFDENDHRLSVLAGREDTLMVGSVKAHNSDINSMIFINDRDLISCSSDKTVKLWTSVDQGSDQVKVRTINQRSYAIYACDFSKSRNLLVVAAMDGQTLVWDTDKWIKLATLVAPGHAAIRTCSISQDSAYVIVGGDDDMAHIFDLYDFSYIRGLKGHEATVFYATFTHESSHVLTGDNDGVINCWNVLYTVKEKKMKPSFSVDVAHDLGISCGDCKPMTGDPGDYSIIVTGGNDSLLKVWKIRIAGAKCSTIEAVQTLTGHGCSVMSIKFAPHAKFFVSTSGDKTSRLWDANNFVCLRVLEGHDRYVNCAAFNHDGSLLATGSNDRSFNVWRLSGTLDKSNMARPSSGAVMAEWNPVETKEWLKNSGMPNVAGIAANVAGLRLHDMSYGEMIKTMGLSDGDAQRLIRQNGSSGIKVINNNCTDTVPEEFVCPITQDVMTFPVLCSDGFIYEKAAIEEWLVSRKKTSPMTNLPMGDPKMVPQKELRDRICAFIIR